MSRAALRLIAVAMATISFGALVVLPAQVNSVSAAPYAGAATATRPPGASATGVAGGNGPEAVSPRAHAKPAGATFGAQALWGSRDEPVAPSRTNGRTRTRTFTIRAHDAT